MFPVVLISVLYALMVIITGAAPVLLFDGRIPAGTKADAFDAAGCTPYDPDKSIRAECQTWASIITTDCQPTTSLFNPNGVQAFQMTVTDASIIPQAPGYIQAILVPAPSAYRPAVAGPDAVITYHFSVRAAAQLENRLDSSHDYRLVVVEGQEEDVVKTVFQLAYGTPFCEDGPPSGCCGETTKSANYLRIMGTDVNGAPQTLYKVEFTPDSFHNFAVTVDYAKGAICVHYSVDDQELELKVEWQSCAVCKSPAPIQVGILKMPLGPTPDPRQSGIQECDIQESVVYGGIFIEDSCNRVTTNRFVVAAAAAAA